MRTESTPVRKPRFRAESTVTGPAVLLRKRAARIARNLVDAIDGIDGVCLFGSVARVDASDWSDIDLLVIGSDPTLTPGTILRRLPAPLRPHLSLLYYPTAFFCEHYGKRALFIAHIRHEGRALYDRHGILREVLERAYVPQVDVHKGLDLHLKQMEPYRDTRRFHNNYLFCLAHLYSIGKGVVMLGLAKEGTLEFNRELAFERFAATHPDMRRDIRAVTSLRPFYTLVNKRQPEHLPFSYRTADRAVRRAVSAIGRLAERIERS